MEVFFKGTAYSSGGDLQPPAGCIWAKAYFVILCLTGWPVWASNSWAIFCHVHRWKMRIWWRTMLPCKTMPAGGWCSSWCWSGHFFALFPSDAKKIKNISTNSRPRISREWKRQNDLIERGIFHYIRVKYWMAHLLYWEQKVHEMKLILCRIARHAWEAGWLRKQRSCKNSSRKIIDTLWVVGWADHHQTSNVLLGLGRSQTYILHHTLSCNGGLGLQCILCILCNEQNPTLQSSTLSWVEFFTLLQRGSGAFCHHPYAPYSRGESNLSKLGHICDFGWQTGSVCAPSVIQSLYICPGQGRKLRKNTSVWCWAAHQFTHPVVSDAFML